MASLNWNQQTSENLGVDNTPVGTATKIITTDEGGFLNLFEDKEIDYSKILGEASSLTNENFGKAYNAVSETALKDASTKAQSWFDNISNYIGGLFTSARDTVSATATQVSDYVKYSPHNETSILQDTKSNLFYMGKNALNVTTETVKDIAGKAQEKAKEKLKSVAIYGVVGAVLVLLIIKRKKK